MTATAMRDPYDDDDDCDDPLAGGADGADGDNDPAMMACPNCRKAVVEDAQKCPHCGDWITPVEPRSGKRVVTVLAILIMLGLALLWAVGR